MLVVVDHSRTAVVRNDVLRSVQDMPHAHSSAPFQAVDNAGLSESLLQQFLCTSSNGNTRFACGDSVLHAVAVLLETRRVRPTVYSYVVLL
jgi:hypothetical protein